MFNLDGLSLLIGCLFWVVWFTWLRRTKGGLWLRARWRRVLVLWFVVQCRAAVWCWLRYRRACQAGLVGRAGFWRVVGNLCSPWVDERLFVDSQYMAAVSAMEERFPGGYYAK